MKNTVHVVAPFHSRLCHEKWSHCAFTQITLKQIKIFKSLGFRVVDYSNWGSESVADEHVELLSKDEFLASFSDDGRPAHGNAVIGSPEWQRWRDKLVPQISLRANFEGEHFVAHTFGNSAGELVTSLPNALHVETHIGYDRPGFGAKRVFVSEAWRNYNFGKHGSTAGDHRYSWVVLPYYDRDDWTFRPKASSDAYVAYLGRVTPDKGLATVVDVAKRMPHMQFRLAGSGMSRADFDTGYNPPNNLIFIGEVAGSFRAEHLGNARAIIVPSDYLEPCAGVVCEAALCGTPAVTSSWGGFKETVVEGTTGYTAATLADWMNGVEKSFSLDRRVVRSHAEERFTLEAAAAQYAEIFERLLTLKGKGWYTLPNRPTENSFEGATNGARNITHEV